MERKASGQLSDSPVRLGEPSPKHPSTLADLNFSLGSAEVGAALSSVPLLRSGLVLEREWHFRRPERPDRSPEQLELVVMSSGIPKL